MTDRKHIDPTIYTTRPTDERLEKENRVYDFFSKIKRYIGKGADKKRDSEKG